MYRYAYRTPGVYFEWLDARAPALVPLRTDIAGFVGIAARGPLHQPVEVESWTQFTSTFGIHVPQGYLAYAVEGFFANGGQNCWVVRVADPNLARPASFDLLDGDNCPTLRLTASSPFGPSPGVWGEQMTVSVARFGQDRFSLVLQLQDGGQEVWRNLTMRLASFDLRDRTEQPTLRFEAISPELWKREVTVSMREVGERRFNLTQRVEGRQRGRWENLTMDPSDSRYVENVLNDPNDGLRLITVRDLGSPAPFPDNTPDPRAQNLRDGIATLQADPRYVRTVLNDPETGSRLVTVEHLDSPNRFPANTPSPQARNLLPGAGAGRFTGGSDGLAPQLNLLDGTAQLTLRLLAKSTRSGAEKLTVKVARSGGNRFSLSVRQEGVIVEPWEDLTMDPCDPRYVENVLNDPKDGSRLVAARDLGSRAGFPDNTPDPDASNLRDGAGDLAGGLMPAHLRGEGTNPDQPWGLATLEKVDEVSMVAIPDIMPKTVVEIRYAERQPRCHGVEGEPLVPPGPERQPEYPPHFSDNEIYNLQGSLVGHCEKLKDRVAILDMPRPTPETTPSEVKDWRDQFDTKYAALYFPWLKVLDPDHLRTEGLLRAIPPSGHVAGAYARGDLTVGVHKPPANEALAAVQDVLVQVDEIYHGDLNVSNVNAIRVYNGRGVRIGGARTLSSDPEWQFVNVRRLLIMIEEAVEEQMQWTVFEPNNPALWRDIDRVVRSFLDGIWQLGMLDGATAEEAYHVRCDEATNPPHETDQGRMICEIGVLPPWPAEFVIVRIGITEGGAEIIEE